MGGAHASGVGRARLRGRARTPTMRGSAYVCGGRARTSARWGARTSARWGARTPARWGARMSKRARTTARGAHACARRARRPARWEARTPAGGAHPCGEGAHACEVGGAHVCGVGGLLFFLGLSHLTFKSSLGIHASNFNSTFVVMSELELSFLMVVLAPYFNTMDLVKILENSAKFHIQIVAVTLKVTSYKTISKKKKVKKN
jgi:hypothetical protein